MNIYSIFILNLTLVFIISIEGVYSRGHHRWRPRYSYDDYEDSYNIRPRTHRQHYYRPREYIHYRPRNWRNYDSALDDVVVVEGDVITTEPVEPETLPEEPPDVDPPPDEPPVELPGEDEEPPVEERPDPEDGNVVKGDRDPEGGGGEGHGNPGEVIRGGGGEGDGSPGEVIRGGHTLPNVHWIRDERYSYDKRYKQNKRQHYKQYRRRRPGRGGAIVVVQLSRGESEAAAAEERAHEYRRHIQNYYSGLGRRRGRGRGRGRRRGRRRGRGRGRRRGRGRGRRQRRG